jgi:hypothetical protein
MSEKNYREEDIVLIVTFISNSYLHSKGLPIIVKLY